MVEFGRSRRSSSNSAQPAFTSEGITVNVPEDTGSVNNIQDSINASAVDAEVSAAFIDSTGLQLSGLDDTMVPSTLAMKKLKSHSSTPLTPTAAGALSTSNCTTVTTTCANSNHSPTRHLCHHLLLESLFANELKTLFHCVTSCHAANVQFNCLATSTSQSKAVNVPLLCKDMKHCEDSCNLMTMVQSTMNSKRGLGGYGSAQTVFRPPVLNQILTFNSSLASRSSAGASIGLGLAASTSGTALATMENNLLMSAVAASNTNNDNANSQQNSKFKGINLSTQTILMMADRDTILRTLLILDNTLAIPSSRNASLGGTTAVTSSSQGASTNPLIATVATANNRLYTFVEAADPTQSFIDLSLQLDEPVEELISMAHYLQGWGLAEVIPLIYSESIYMVHPSANVKILINERVNKAFEALIGSFDLSSSASSSSSNITQLLNGSSSAALPPGFSRHRSGSYGSSYHSMKDLSLPSNNTATWSGNKRNPALHSSSHGNSQSLLSSSLDNHSPLMTVFGKSKSLYL